MKWRVIGGIVLAICVVGIIGYMSILARPAGEPQSSALPLAPLPHSPRDASYLFDTKEVTLRDGFAELETEPESASKSEVRIFGEPVYGDLNDDGMEDAALILTYDAMGSGTFYYAAAALRDGEGYLGTNAIFLGDRIAPQNIEVWHGILVAQYAERATDTPMTEEPAVGVSRYLTVFGATLTEVGPLTSGERVVAGALLYADDTWTLTPCGGAPETLSHESRSLAALEVVYAERARELPEGSSVFVVVAGANVPPETATTSSAALLSVSRIVSAPRDGSCAD